jgi:hypothetical protein
VQIAQYVRMKYCRRSLKSRQPFFSERRKEQADIFKRAKSRQAFLLNKERAGIFSKKRKGGHLINHHLASAFPT